MRSIIGLAAFSLLWPMAAAGAVSIDAAPVVPAAPRFGLGVAGNGWLGLRPRPVSIARLIGEAADAGDMPLRQAALGPTPDHGRVISFARISTDMPDGALLRDAPRFSRLPGKQVDNYELGLRAALFDHSIALQAGVFYDKYRNLQTSVRQQGKLMTATAGKAKLYGVEGLARWSPLPQISLFATAAYGESRLKNRLRDGRKFRLSPDRSASLGAVLLLPAGRGQIALTPSLVHQSAIGLGRDASGSGAVTLVNAQLGYAGAGGFAVEALISNLFDRKYDRPSADAPMLIAGEPRVIGLRARVRFGN